jgi:cell division protein FtsI/penicillin-binding protein 2
MILLQNLYNDRSLLANIPPGSPSKILTGLIGLQEEVMMKTLVLFVVMIFLWIGA